MEEWNVLMETWVDVKGWEKIRNRMPKSYIWVVQ